jgi:hypothetical protein
MMRGTFDRTSLEQTAGDRHRSGLRGGLELLLIERRDELLTGLGVVDPVVEKEHLPVRGELAAHAGSIFSFARAASPALSPASVARRLHRED